MKICICLFANTKLKQEILHLDLPSCCHLASDTHIPRNPFIIPPLYLFMAYYSIELTVGKQIKGYSITDST